MSSLMERLKKNSKIKETASLLESKFFEAKDQVVTDVPAINIALSGSLDGGLQSGLTVVAGPSKHFKSSICLVMAAAYQKKYPDGVILFYDSEFGSPQSYFEAFGVDTNRVIHTPITDIEQLKFDIMAQLQELKKGDHVMILIDSIGNLASKKEVEDALNEKAVADMSRAKQLKSLFRMVTPHLTMKDLPMVCINHTYQTLELWSKHVVSGGCLLAGTEIRMADGTLREVQDIREGEYVETKLGPKMVTAAWNPDTLADGTPECYEIQFSDGSTVVCSDEHRFLVGGLWVEAMNLKKGQSVELLHASAND